MPMTVMRRRFVDSDRIERLYADLDGKEVIWGWTTDATDYPDGTDIHLVVAANNLGTNTIPRRPILSLSFDKHIAGLEALADAMNTALINAEANDFNPLLVALGQRAASEFKRDFGNIGPMQRLSDSTIAKKGHGTIWIETGHAKEQVNFKIRDFAV